MKKYGLQLRINPQQQKQRQQKKPVVLPTAPGFGVDDGDEDNVEMEIARHAAKNRALKEVEEKHKKALEEDPSAFDYDGVYDEMKQNIARPVIQDLTERKSKYIERLMQKAKQRQMEQEIIYEKKLVKERTKEDHLFQDKEKFVTGAYRKKLEEQQKWMEEERLRQFREERDDVTKKSVTDFYFHLDKNVAFGAQGAASGKDALKDIQAEALTHTAQGAASGKDALKDIQAEALTHTAQGAASGKDALTDIQAEALTHTAQDAAESSNAAASVGVPVPAKTETKQLSEEHQIEKPFKRSGDALAAARERYLARKKSKGTLG